MTNARLLKSNYYVPQCVFNRHICLDSNQEHGSTYANLLGLIQTVEQVCLRACFFREAMSADDMSGVVAAVASVAGSPGEG